MMNTNTTLRDGSAVVLRIGIALVVLWFGFSQLGNGIPWIAYLPLWTTHLPISQIGLVYLNGWFEIVFGFMLLFGFYTRFTALLLALHLLDITFTVGYGQIGVRDFGLMMATLSIFCHGTSQYSLDEAFEKNKNQKNA